MMKNIKVNISQLENYYKIYCNKTLNPKNRMFKTKEEFMYIMSRAGMRNSFLSLRRKTCNVSKIHADAVELLAFGCKADFMPICEDVIIPKCDTLEASLRIMKNKNMEEILHE